MTTGMRPRVGFVVHVMNVAGAEVLVAETIQRLGKRIDPVVFCVDSVGVLGERLRSNGVPVIAFGRTPGLDLGLPWRMSREMRRWNVQVVHAHQYTPFFYGAIAAHLSGGRPRVIFTEHGRHYPDVVSGRRRMLNRFVLRHFAHEINAVCQFSARALNEKDGFPADRIRVIPNGVDVTTYERPRNAAAIRSQLGLELGRKYVASIARFHPVKDHSTLLRAFSIVAKARPDADLLLVGDGILRTDLERQVRALELGTRVHFMGIRDDVAEILSAIDVFALTSVSEAASITLLEAMASGKPVVVTDVGGNPEIVRNGIDGLMAARGDATQVACALLRILDDASLADAMGHSGAARVHSHFRLEQTIEHYGTLYNASARAQAA
jgi:glycosyltransferase involved in cell wall biosynthesis